MFWIWQVDVDEVKVWINIVDIIGECVVFKFVGVGFFKGLCLFYDEKSLSFYVCQQVGYYYCFGCGEFGDVYLFLWEMDYVSFIEVVECFVGCIGYMLYYEDGGVVFEMSGCSCLYVVNIVVVEFFCVQLLLLEVEVG